MRSPSPVILLSLTILAMLAACASPGASPSGTPSDDPTPEATPEQTSMDESPGRSLAPASQQPSRAPGGSSTALTGTLGSDAVEGGCAYLEAEGGTRYEVIYPSGWELQKSPLELIAPDGRTVATAGDSVTVRGSEAGDMASICQIGPIFRASEVVTEPG